ncbi:MCE family protein [Rhodococcus sp. 3Y1]
MDALSGVVNDNDVALRSLLTGAQQTTATLIEQKDTLETLLGNADLVMSTIADRRDVLNALVQDLNQLSTTLAQFLGDNQALIDSVMGDIHVVTGVLSENEQSLTTLLDNFAPASATSPTRPVTATGSTSTRPPPSSRTTGCASSASFRGVDDHDRQETRRAGSDCDLRDRCRPVRHA